MCMSTFGIAHPTATTDTHCKLWTMLWIRGLSYKITESCCVLFVIIVTIISTNIFEWWWCLETPSCVGSVNQFGIVDGIVLRTLVVRIAYTKPQAPPNDVIINP